MDQATRHGQQPQSHVRQGVHLDNRQAAIEALLRHTNSSATQSAPTTLGRAARVILDIIERFPDGSQPVEGRRPIGDQPTLQRLLQAALGHQAQQAGGRTPQASNTAQSGVAQSSTATATSASASGSASATAAMAHLGTTGTGTVAAQGTSLIQQGALDQLVQYLTQGLRSTVQQSGMFYEAQLAQFAFGKGNAASLQQQPQNAPTTAQQTPTSPNTGDARAAGNTSNTSQGAPTSSSSSLATALAPDSAHQGIIRQQLEVLATQQFTWRGEAWANTPVEWRVEREQEYEGSANHKQTVNSERWNSKLVMQLASLGDIEFEISLHQNQVSLRINANEAASSLRPHLQDLNDRLGTHGLHIQHLSLNTQRKLADDIEPSHE